MMPYGQRTNPEIEQAPHAPQEALGLMDEQVPQSVEPSTSLMSPTPRSMSEGLLGEAFRETTEEDPGCSGQASEDLCLYDNNILPLVLRKEALALLPYLLYKYWSNQPFCDVDMMKHISVGHQPHFDQILDKASIFMQLLFGIDMKVIDPDLRTRALYLAAGITYDGIESDVPGMPKTGLLIIVLCTIFMEGGCAPEETIWHVLSKMEVHPDREHFIYGIPRKLVMEDFVWEQYIEYQEMPESDPISYQFRWGPRAYAETSKRRVLEHWANFSRVDPRSFGSLYEEAVQEEQAANVHDDTSPMQE